MQENNAHLMLSTESYWEVFAPTVVWCLGLQDTGCVFVFGAGLKAVVHIDNANNLAVRSQWEAQY